MGWMYRFFLLLFPIFIFTKNGQAQDFENLILIQKNKVDKSVTFKKGKKIKLLFKAFDKPIMLGKLVGKKKSNIYLVPLDISRMESANSTTFQVPIEHIRSIEHYSKFKESKLGKGVRFTGSVLLVASSIGIILSSLPAIIIPENDNVVQPQNKISLIGFGVGLGINITTAKRNFTLGKWLIY